MGAYALRRVLLAVPTLVVLTILVFGLTHLAPGSPALELARRRSSSGQITQQDIERARAELGLDRPLLVQYASWVGDVLHGDLGRSFTRGTPVDEEISKRAGATLQLAGAGLAGAALLAVPLGTVAAMFHGRRTDDLLRLVALTGASLPSFYLAYLLIGLFATWLGVLPVAGRAGASSLILPATTLALGPAAVLSRLLRASLLEIFPEDYMRAARSRGFTRTYVVIWHGLRNATIPVITVLGTLLGHLLTGAVIAEVIFAWPGLGQLGLDAVMQRDLPLIQALILLAGSVFITINLLVDLSYAVIDPRVRLGTGT